MARTPRVNGNGIHHPETTPPDLTPEPNSVEDLLVRGRDIRRVRAEIGLALSVEVERLRGLFMSYDHVIVEVLAGLSTRLQDQLEDLRKKERNRGTKP